MSKKFSLNESIPGWGWVGFSNIFVEIPNVAEASVSAGIERECNPGETFSSPVAGGQLETGGEFTLPLFSFFREEAGRTWLRMDLEADAPFGFSSLYELSNHLRHPDAASREDFDRLLSDLDHLFVLLSEAFDAVNRLGLGVGLVDPKNVLYYFDREERMRLVLPDLFFWNQAVGDPPRFISSRSEFIGLWADADLADGTDLPFESERETIDFVDRFLEQSKSDTSKDARTLARLIAWSVTGVCGSVGAASRGYAGEIWPVLKRADGGSPEGEITSSLQLGREIRGAAKSPSSVIRLPSQVMPRKSRTPRLSVKHLSLAVLVLLLAVLFPRLADWSVDIPQPPPPPLKYDLCKECEATSKVHEWLTGRQVPLIKMFREGYGGSPLSSKTRINGQAVTQNLLQKQADLLEKQIEVLADLYNELQKSGGPSNAEMGCLQKESERIAEALGTHVRVLYEQTDPEVNELPDPVALVKSAVRISGDLHSKPFYRKSGNYSWDQEFVELLTITGVKANPEDNAK